MEERVAKDRKDQDRSPRAKVRSSWKEYACWYVNAALDEISAVAMALMAVEESLKLEDGKDW